MTKFKCQMGKELALVDISTVTHEMYHKLTLFLVRCINYSIAPYAEPVESSQLTCEFLRRKITEVVL